VSFWGLVFQCGSILIILFLIVCYSVYLILYIPVQCLLFKFHDLKEILQHLSVKTGDSNV
jgi:hypothetical protein